MTANKGNIKNDDINIPSSSDIFINSGFSIAEPTLKQRIDNILDSLERIENLTDNINYALFYSIESDVNDINLSNAPISEVVSYIETKSQSVVNKLQSISSKLV